jgi:hypothetical protein
MVDCHNWSAIGETEDGKCSLNIINITGLNLHNERAECVQFDEMKGDENIGAEVL